MMEVLKFTSYLNKYKTPTVYTENDLMKVLPTSNLIKIKTCERVMLFQTAADICFQSCVSVKLTPKATHVQRFWFSVVSLKGYI